MNACPAVALVGSLMLAAIAPLSVAAAPARGHTVQRILRDGKPVTSAAGLTRGETIADGTRIDVPAHVVVIIVSSGGKSTTTLEPGASVTFISTGQGELVASNGGKSLFSIVPRSLDFFRVQSGETITASVHGTMFSIDATIAGSVTFNCTRGAVNIEKSGYLAIGSVRKNISLTDVISAARRPQATYQPRASWNLGTFANYAQADAFYQQQLTAAQQSGDSDAESAALNNLGNVEEEQGEYADALASHQQSLAIYRNLGDRDGEARALDDIGNVDSEQGRDAEALQSHQQALALFRQLDDRDGAARSLSNIGIAEDHQGRYTYALVSHQQALVLFRELNDRTGEAEALNNLGNVEGDQGHAADALQSYQQALALDRQLGNRTAEAGALDNIGNNEAGQGRYADALQSYQQALALFRQLGVHGGEASVLDNLKTLQERMNSPTPSPSSLAQPR